MLTEIRAFWDVRERSSFVARRGLMLASLSPAERKVALEDDGLTIGCFSFRYTGSELCIAVSKESASPPLGWWRYSGRITVEGHNAPFGTCEVICEIKRSWPGSRVTRLELRNDEEFSAMAQGRVLDTLGALQDEALSLYLGKLHVENADPFPFFAALHSLRLDGCDGKMEAWLSALGAGVENVEITDCYAFSDTTFASMPSRALRRLVLDNTNVSAVSVKQLKCADSLHTLSLMDCRKIDVFQASDFPELRVLILSRTHITSDSLEGIERCRRLKSVNLGGCRGIVDVTPLGSLKELRELFLHETLVTNVGIAALEYCEGLEKLNLGGCVHVSDVNHLGRLGNLLELHLWSTKVTNAGIVGLSSCSSLVELVLDNCVRITDVRPLRLLQSMRWLSLIGTEVDAPGVKELIQCQSLETLALGGTRIHQPPNLWRHEAVVQFLENLT
ncbi:hypothetical protein LSCM1_02060 [Leishmania martiniquensis]|uniref:Uncharacterized protein n=1 Tax=Leishmania martiniquensis TaxID=1580590 RepID=A0A836G4Z3_9TRYP|nr:hypothetical protein LSCM1_02060 [Leishmania martiniquensis]